MIETLVVDLGGVAARFTPARRLQALASLSGLSPGEVQACWLARGLEAQAERGVFSKDRIVSRIQEAIGFQCEAQQLIDAWSLAFDLDEAVLELVEASRTSAVIFTNNGPMLDLCLVGPLGRLGRSFREVICSWHLGVAKPDALAFERAADRLDAQLDRLLLLDDSQANVDAAFASGWNARRVTNAAEVKTALRAFGL